MFSSYVSNLTAFLTVAKLESQVESIDDLVRQHKINYSVVKDSPAHRYIISRAYIENIMYQKYKEMLFKEKSPAERDLFTVWDYPLNDQFSRMLKTIEQNGFLKNAQQAIEWIRESTYEKPNAYIGGEHEALYLDLKNCDLHVVGIEFSSRPVGFIFPKGSPLRESVNHAYV